MDLEWIAYALGQGSVSCGSLPQVNDDDCSQDENMDLDGANNAGQSATPMSGVTSAEIVQFVQPRPTAPKSTDVSATELDMLLQPLGPYTVVPLSGVHDRVLAQVALPGTQLDEDLITMASHFTDPYSSVMLGSKAQLASRLELDR